MKISFLGDSIRMGYTPRVIQMLGDGYDVFNPPENGRFSSYTLRNLFEYKNDMEGSEIVHWNNGHWDHCNLFGDGNFTPIDIYVQTMLRICDILQSRHKKIIFATTTPVYPTHGYNKNAAIMEYNAAIVPKLMEKGVIINDLHTTVNKDVEKYIREDDKIHLTPEGIEVCATQVVSFIKEVEKSL